MPKRILFTSIALLSAAAFAHAGPITAEGYVWNNFDLPGAGNQAGAGTNINGISNTGSVVGFSLDNGGNTNSYVRAAAGNVTAVGSAGTVANGINSQGEIAASVNNTAVVFVNGVPEPVGPTTATSAFGINDHGAVVGQFSSSAGTPGFLVSFASSSTFTPIYAPGANAATNAVNAQGINNSGTIAGFYVGNDGQDHGFFANSTNVGKDGIIHGIAVADPNIPNVPGEPGATFMFSQFLGINDKGIIAGYYGDSTTSQHGFLFDSNTDSYSFLDDPAEGFLDGVEITQITGINNQGEIAGFYSDANGAFHGFTACPVGETCLASSAAAPEPATLSLFGAAFTLLGLTAIRRRRSRN